MLVIPATGEAGAGESLEPRRWRLQGAKITLLHSPWAAKWDSVSRNKQKNPLSEERAVLYTIYNKIGKQSL